MSEYILLGSEEGAEWKNAKIFSIGTLDKIKKTFDQRERPLILWYLIDKDLFDQGNYDINQIKNVFFSVLKQHPDLVDKNYQYKPFVGFFDMIATSRSWGILKTL